MPHPGLLLATALGAAPLAGGAPNAATAQMEADIAAQHATLAATAEDLAGIQMHTTHMLHALDASTAARGPGKGLRADQGRLGVCPPYRNGR